MDDEKPVRGLRANCNFINEFEVELDQKLFEEVIAGFTKTDQPKEEKMIKIEKSEIKKSKIDRLWEIGQYYIWLEIDGQIGNFSFYTSPDEAKKDFDEYDEMMVKQFADYWSSRCPQ